MKASEYQSLCLGASKQLGLKNPGALADDGEIVLNDVAMSLAFDEARSATQLDVLVDMGEVDAARRADIYEAMLTMNLTLDPAEQGTLALDVDSNHALLCARVECKESMNPSRLAEMLNDYALFARQFRQDVLAAEPAEAQSLKTA